MTSNLTNIKVTISNKAEIADAIFRFDLVSEGQSKLPPFEPGAHILVRVPNGKERQYSLCDISGDGSTYSIAVKYEPQGKGGSKSLIEDSSVGDTLLISAPRNDFPLEVGTGQYIFIAGGIGITPIYTMIQQLQQQGVSAWALYYLCRNPESTAFLAELQEGDFSGTVQIHHTQGDSGKRLDLKSLLEQQNDRYLYCCGPAGLMDSVRELSSHWSPGSVHMEDFGDGVAIHSDQDGAFRVLIADTDVEVVVGADQTIIQSLEDAGVDVPYSCESGTCGTCVCELVDGVADHRDTVLGDEERKGHIIPCVSRSLTDSITIRLL